MQERARLGDAEAPVRLVERVTPDGVLLSWRGAPRPGVVAYDLYDRRLGPRGEAPVRLNDEPMPLAGEWIDTAIHAPVALESDPLAELLEARSVPPPALVSISFIQGWLDLLTTGHSPPLRGAPRTINARTPATHFLLERDGSGKQGAPIVAQQREWTPDLERQRDEAIRRALDELRRRGVTFPGDPPPTLEELERHIRGGIGGDRGELGREDPPSEGRTTPAPQHPATGKHQSDLTLNGDTVLDAEPQQLEALLYHELVHVAQNLNFVVREALKDIVINRIEREVEAYDRVWTLATSGEFDMRAGLIIREAREATIALMKLYRDFARKLLELEEALTDAQKDAIRANRRRIRALLQRYQAFLTTAPAVAINALGTTNLVEGQPMNTKELVDYLLDRAFR